MDIDECAAAELPEPIIHHILSLVPSGVCTKELIQLSLLSKCWLRALSSYQIIDISQPCCLRNNVHKSQLFIQSVDNTMTRYRGGHIGKIQKLKLHLNSEVPCYASNDYINNVYSPLLDKWINIALDNLVEDLDLGVKVRNVSNWTYQIPTRVIMSSAIKSLSLGCQVCLPPTMDTCLSPLTSLEISRAPHIDHDALQRLIEACPAIENLTIDSELMYEIKVCGLHHIKTIAIRRSIGSKSFKVKIEAPSLQTLSLSGERNGNDYNYTATVNIDCGNLKCLKLTRDIGINEEQFRILVSKLPLLESLELHDCGLNKLNLDTNTMLEKIELKFIHLRNIRPIRVQISYPNELVQFRCESMSAKLFPSIRVAGNNCPRHVEAVLKGTCPIHIFPYWFRKLRESMLGINSTHNHTSLSVNITWKRQSHEAKEMVPTHLPACDINNLTLAVTAPSQSYPVILSRFFSTLHPATLQASLVDDENGQGRDFLKFLCQTLANIGDNLAKCWACSGHIKCWKHQLKEAKIECIKISHEKILLDWNTMLKRLSTLIDALTVHQCICFRLQWAT